MDELTDTEKAMLTFERQWWKYAGAKETAIRDRFDMSSARYYQVQNILIDKPAALAFDPLNVKRLQRMREDRRRQRVTARYGIEFDPA